MNNIFLSVFEFSDFNTKHLKKKNNISMFAIFDKQKCYKIPEISKKNLNR